MRLEIELLLITNVGHLSARSEDILLVPHDQGACEAPSRKEYGLHKGDEAPNQIGAGPSKGLGLEKQEKQSRGYF